MSHSRNDSCRVINDNQCSFHVTNMSLDLRCSAVANDGRFRSFPCPTFGCLASRLGKSAQSPCWSNWIPTFQKVPKRTRSYPSLVISGWRRMSFRQSFDSFPGHGWYPLNAEIKIENCQMSTRHTSMTDWVSLSYSPMEVVKLRVLTFEGAGCVSGDRASTLCARSAWFTSKRTVKRHRFRPLLLLQRWIIPGKRNCVCCDAEGGVCVDDDEICDDMIRAGLDGVELLQLDVVELESKCEVEPRPSP